MHVLCEYACVFVCLCVSIIYVCGLCCACNFVLCVRKRAHARAQYVYLCMYASVCMHVYMYVFTHSSVVAELEAELNTQSILQWKQDILDNLKDESGDTSTSITIPFLLLGSKQDKVAKYTMFLRVHGT